MILRGLPFTSALFTAFVEVTDILLSRGPTILSFTVWFAINVLTSVSFASYKCICSITVFEAHIPLSFIAISIGPIMYTVSMCF